MRSGKRGCGEDEYTLAVDEDSRTATIKISVNAVTKGVLKIDKLKEQSVFYISPGQYVYM